MGKSVHLGRKSLQGRYLGGESVYGMEDEEHLLKLDQGFEC